MTDTHAPKRVADLEEGDMVDGETLGDYLSPDHSTTAEFEYFTVEAVIPEVEGCTLVEFDVGGYGLPPDLIVQVANKL